MITFTEKSKNKVHIKGRICGKTVLKDDWVLYELESARPIMNNDEWYRVKNGEKIIDTFRILAENDMTSLEVDTACTIEGNLGYMEIDNANTDCPICGSKTRETVSLHVIKANKITIVDKSDAGNERWGNSIEMYARFAYAICEGNHDAYLTDTYYHVVQGGCPTRYSARDLIEPEDNIAQKITGHIVNYENKDKIHCYNCNVTTFIENPRPVIYIDDLDELDE